MAQIICENCGAYFDAKEAKCPNCGFISYPGAEEKFMQDLEDVKEDLEEVVTDQKTEYKAELSKQVKKTIWICVIVAAVILLIIGSVKLVNYLMEQRYSNHIDVKAEMLWERETYPKLNQLLFEGKYNELLDFQLGLYEDKNNTHSLYSWEYYWFLTAYNNYDMVNWYLERLDNGEKLSKLDGSCLVYEAMWLYYRVYEQDTYNQVFRDQEMDAAHRYSREMESVLFDRIGITKEEAEALYKECMKDGYFNMDPCYDYGKKNYKEFK